MLFCLAFESGKLVRDGKSRPFAGKSDVEIKDVIILN